MASHFGRNINIQIFGQSHSQALGVTIDGLPAGYVLDMGKIQAFLDRRRGGQNAYSTPRKEADTPNIICGIVDDMTCGAPMTATFQNKDTRSADYDEQRTIPRPSHADYYADEKYLGAQDYRGGGHFSGRMTLPLTFAGAVCVQILEKWDIHIGAHIDQIYTVLDQPFDPLKLTRKDLQGPQASDFPVNDPSVAGPMQQAIADAAKEGDSVGGIIECAAIGLPIGAGSPMFEGIENQLARAIFGIPAVRGIEFGAGFDAAGMTGSEHNDAFTIDTPTPAPDSPESSCPGQANITHQTNNAGGVVGGLTTGAPLIFRVAIKPTPSIAAQQDSVDLETMKPAKLNITGRHDPCIVPRAVPVVEAATAIVLVDELVKSFE